MNRIKVLTMVIVMSLTGVLLAGCVGNSDPYIIDLMESEVFANDYDSLRSQLEVAEMVDDHFATKKDGIDQKALVVMLEGCRADSVVSLFDYGKGVAKVAEKGGAYLTSAIVKDGQKAVVGAETNALSMLTGVASDEFNVFKSTDYKPAEPLSMVAKIGASQRRATIVTERDNYISNSLSLEIEWAIDNAPLSSYVDTETSLLMQNKMLESLSVNDLVVGIYSEGQVSGDEHGFGADNGGYMNSIAHINFMIDELLETIESRVTYAKEDWLIVVASTYGGKSNLSASKNEITFTITNKKLD